MTGTKIFTTEGSVFRTSPDAASLPPLPEDVEAFAQAMKASLDDTPGAITRQQEKTTTETAPQTGSQAQEASEKLVANVATPAIHQQGEAAKKMTLQTGSQAQAASEKLVVNVVTSAPHQQGETVTKMTPQTGSQAQETSKRLVANTAAPAPHQQEEAATKMTLQTGSQAQAASEKLVANTGTSRQGRTPTETVLQTGSQERTISEKPVADVVTQQQGRTSSQDDPQLQRFEKAEPMRDVQTALSSQIPRTGQKGLKLDDERLMQALAGEKRKTEKGEDVPSLPPINGPLDGLLGTQMAGKEGAPPEMGPVNADLHIENEIIQKCVERILVSRPEDGASEVRIQMGRDILPETEICLSRGVDGQLSVHMYTANESSFQSMVAMRNDLLNNLEQQEGDAVRVEISFQDNAETGDMNRRSRGYIQQDDDQTV